MLSNNPPAAESARFLQFTLQFGFLISGTVTVLIGQVLPILSARLALDDTQAGYFFIAQFSGSIIGALSTMPMVRRFGFGTATALGFLVMTIGVLGLNAGAWSVCLAAFVVMGFGIGVTLPTINMLTVELNPRQVTPALNFLNFFWGAGAIVCKPFVDFFGTPDSIFQPTVMLASLLLINGATIFYASRRNPPRQIREPSAAENPAPIWTTATAWLIAFFNFVHVGFESGMGGWITTYAARLPNQNGAAWLSPTLSYFAFFILGRLAAPFCSKFLNENRMLLGGLLTMTLGVLILLWGTTLEILVIGAAIAGLGTSSIFPTNMARFTQTFGATATRRATPLFIAGTLGAALTTWLIGYVSTNYQNLRFGMVVLLASCISLVVLQVYLSASSRTTVST